MTRGVAKLGLGIMEPFPIIPPTSIRARQTTRPFCHMHDQPRGGGGRFLVEAPLC